MFIHFSCRDPRLDDLTRLQLIKSRFERKESETSRGAPSILKQILNNSTKLKSLNKSTHRSSNDTMSVRKINYSEIFKNSVYNKIPPTSQVSILPAVSSSPRLPQMKRSVTKSSLNFPNSDVKLDITSTFDKKTNDLKFV